MKEEKIQLEKNNVLNLIIELISKIKDLEENLLLRNGFFSLLLSRCMSIAGVMLVIYVSSLLFFFLGSYFVSAYFKNIQSINTEYWWSIPLVIGLPLLIKLIANFNNRDYVFCERVINLLETLSYSTIQTGRIKFLFEIVLSIVFILFYSVLLMLSLTIFLNSQFLEGFINTNSSYGIFISISATVYITVRILAMEEKTNFQKYLKAKRSFYLWSLATLIIFIFLVSDLYGIKDELSIKFPYTVITLLLALEKTRDSYRHLSNCLKRLLI